MKIILFAEKVVAFSEDSNTKEAIYDITQANNAEYCMGQYNGTKFKVG